MLPCANVVGGMAPLGRIARRLWRQLCHATNPRPEARHHVRCHTRRVGARGTRRPTTHIGPSVGGWAHLIVVADADSCMHLHASASSFLQARLVRLTCPMCFAAGRVRAQRMHGLCALCAVTTVGRWLGNVAGSGVKEGWADAFSASWSCVVARRNLALLMYMCGCAHYNCSARAPAP